MANRNARVIIPFTIAAWLLAIVVTREETPRVVQGVLIAAFAVAVPTIVFNLMAKMGWSTLAKLYRAKVPFSGRWQVCPTGQMSLLPVDHPDYEKNRLRVNFALLVGITDRALHLAILFSKVPILRRLFPTIEIPWSDVKSARPYEAGGWFRQSEPGALVTLNYDPSYTGTFIELEAGEPPVFLQLPAEILAPAASRLPRAASSHAESRPADPLPSDSIDSA